MRSIDDLYQRVRDYEMVLTREAPLADALNSRIDCPRLEKLAYTPRGLAYRDDMADETLDRRELFLRIVRETDCSWKKSLYCLENILDCWQETGKLETITEYPEFHIDGMDSVLKVIEETPSVFRDMQEYEWEKTNEVAVIGEYQFKALDRRVLPDEYDSIDFEESGGDVSLPPFSIFPSSTRLVHTLAEQITPENASRIALMMVPSSPYQHMVTSMLKAREIPVMGQQTLTETQIFRTLYQLLRCSVGTSRLRLQDLQPILSETGARPSIKHNEKYLDSVNAPALRPVNDLVNKIPGMKFTEVVDSFTQHLSQPDQHQQALSQFRSVLGSNGLAHARVTPNNLANLQLYLNHFDVPVESKTRCGVLVANPTSQAFVDRELVFYLGMDADWTRNVPEKPWINREAHRSRNLKDFQILLQNGQKRYFMVQEQRANEHVTPCFYFHLFFEDDFESFSDHDPHEYFSGDSRPSFRRGKTFTIDSPDRELLPYKTLSQSTLNRLTRSPREWLVNRLVTTTENHYMTRGNLFHDYAECYVNAPEKVQDNETDILDWMVDRMGEFLDEWQRPEVETEFRIGTEAIRNFVDSKPRNQEDIQGFSPAQSKNSLADQFKIPIDSRRTEAWFENPRLGCHGKVDWVSARDRLVDYKSGSRQTAASVIKSSNLDLLEDDRDPDFQALLYLSHLRTVYPDRPLSFVFFYFLEDLDDRVQGKPGSSSEIVRVHYYPETFEDHLLSDTFVEWICEYKTYRTFLDTISRQSFRDFFARHSIPVEYEKQALLKTEFASRWRSFVADREGAQRDADRFLKKIVHYRKTHFFREDLDQFDEFLVDQREQLNRYRQESFPLYGYQGEIDLSRLNRRDLILPV